MVLGLFCLRRTCLSLFLPSFFWLIGNFMKSCNKPFEDPSFFQRGDEPYCEHCFSVLLRNEIWQTKWWGCGAISCRILIVHLFFDSFVLFILSFCCSSLRVWARFYIQGQHILPNLGLRNLNFDVASNWWHFPHLIAIKNLAIIMFSALTANLKNIYFFWWRHVDNREVLINQHLSSARTGIGWNGAHNLRKRNGASESDSFDSFGLQFWVDSGVIQKATPFHSDSSEWSWVPTRTIMGILFTHAAYHK